MDLEDCDALLAEAGARGGELYEPNPGDSSELALLREEAADVLMHGAARAE